MITGRDLKEAIAADRLSVHYQPKVDLSGERPWRIAGVEALVRWDHPRLGIQTPYAFVPLAEETGLIRPLTEFVLGTALRQVRLWQDEGLALSVAVNLSPRLLADLELPDRFSDLLRQHGVDSSRLILEVTESAAMADTARTMDILTRFRLKGIGLSMDDFGTGYSSLVQLHRLPFSELKIDRSFVMELDQNTEAALIARSITDLAHNLGLSVCAEGVESERAMDFLRAIGCERAQGYWISRPAPAADLASLLTRSDGTRGRERAKPRDDPSDGALDRPSVKPRVLVIDDDATVRATLRNILEDGGFTVMEATDGRQGMRLFEASPAELVISDIFMPEMDGIETIRELRRRHPDIGIIAISGGGAVRSMEHLRSAGKLGADLTLAKPIRPDELVAAARSLLRATGP